MKNAHIVTRGCDWERGCIPWLLVLSFMLSMCGEGYAPLREPQKTDCTIGLAMGNATPDGRPICWKNRDWDDGNNHLIYSDSGTYAYIGIGGSYTMMGLNETGISVGNSLVHNLGDGGDNFAPLIWALRNASSVEQVRQAIIDETEGTDSHWTGRGASGCFPYMDSEGNASMFEIGGYYYYEYDPTNPNRLAQFPMQVVARANEAHGNSDHTDDSDTGGDRYTTARDMMIDRAESGGITIEEMLQVSRRGEPDGYYLMSNFNTRATQVNHGVNAGEDPRIATMWASVGQPDYCIFVPVWVAAGDSLSSRLTSRNDTDGLAGRAWEIYDGMDNSDYDDYVNALYAGFQANLLEATDMVREHWFVHGFDVAQADALTDEAAETAWHIMNSMAQGSGRNLNEPPELTALEIQQAGGSSSFSFSRTASDPDGSLVVTEWDFGDGTSAGGDQVTHEYMQDGTFLVRCRVEDDDGSRNSKWIYVAVFGEPVCGDGVLDGGEACDPGAPANHHCCDLVTCQWIPSGEIDPQSVCSGAPDCQMDVCDGTGSCTLLNLDDGSSCADDGVFCNGPEECLGGACLSTGSPCPESECSHCNEAADNCLDPVGTACTSDGLFCTGLETCDDAGQCASAGDPCDDGQYCNGFESCDPVDGCLAGVDPCDDQDQCTFDLCDEDADLCSHDPDPACADGGSGPDGGDDVSANAGCSCGISKGAPNQALAILLAGLVLLIRRRRLKGNRGQGRYTDSWAAKAYQSKFCNVRVRRVRKLWEQFLGESHGGTTGTG